MIVGLTGATGFVGRALTPYLQRDGHTVRPVSTRNGVAPEALKGCDAVVHLAGEPVAQRWTTDARARIESSRVDGTRALVQAMHTHRPQVFVSSSAVGYYGSRGDDVLTEAEPAAGDFLGRVAKAWEGEALIAESFGIRVARIRTGMVLGRNGGALQKMLLPFKLGLGGPIGGGQQWVSWIHMADLTALIAFLLKESTVRGVFNAVSPNPVTNATFTRALGEAVHRPAIIPVPALAVKLLFGEMSEVILGSQRAVPDAAIRAGFTFRYPDIFGALTHVLS
ncbi:MAG: TIGR01777 family oxidoreductase [Acidobacteriota bacterium]